MRINILPLLLILFALFISGNVQAQKHLNERTFNGQLIKDEITRAYVTPIKIVWLSDNNNNQVENPQVLLIPFDGQLTTSGEGMCVFKSDSDMQASVLLDFGKELYGGIEIAAGIRDDKKPVKVRIRLGESVTEAMSNCIKLLPFLKQFLY